MTFFYKFFKWPKGGDFIQSFNPHYGGWLWPSLPATGAPNLAGADSMSGPGEWIAYIYI